MDRKELIESDEYWEEIIDNLLYNHLMGEISKKKFIKSILKIKNEIIAFSLEHKEDTISKFCEKHAITEQTLIGVYNQYLKNIKQYIEQEEKTDEAKCRVCGSIMLMEHRYDSSFKICMKCGANYKE